MESLKKRLAKVTPSSGGREREAGESSSDRSFLSRFRSASPEPAPAPDDDTPEAAILRAIKSFARSGGPSNPNPGEEVLYLPTIVDIAESSPTAAREAATAIRKNLDVKRYAGKPHIMYNSVMLMRILADNPGRTFTRNTNEPKFYGACKEILRGCKDPSTWQIMTETLEYFETTKREDEGLAGLAELWRKEKKLIQSSRARAGMPAQHFTPTQGQSSGGQWQQPPPVPPRHSTSVSRRGLPDPEELVARVAEAQTSAKLLEQVLGSTPQSEIVDNELIKEFVDRCKLASRSMHAYISADDPAPDEDTLTTLIITNDQLSLALTRHREAVEKTLRQRDTARTDNARVVDVAADDGVQELEDPTSPISEPRHARQDSLSVPGTVPAQHGGRPPSPPSPVSPVTPIDQRGRIQYRY